MCEQLAENCFMKVERLGVDPTTSLLQVQCYNHSTNATSGVVATYYVDSLKVCKN